jgi:ADP-ribose pyrophosphatase
MKELKYHYEYPHPAVAADCVIFGFDGLSINVLLIQRGIDPFKGRWALPGGFIRMDESADEGARRELEEETGYTCEKVELLNSIYTTVAFCNEKIDIYLARDLKPGKQHLDEDEFINVEAYTVDELKEMIYQCKIQDSKTICGILTYASKFCV